MSKTWSVLVLYPNRSLDRNEQVGVKPVAPINAPLYCGKVLQIAEFPFIVPKYEKLCIRIRCSHSTSTASGA